MNLFQIPNGHASLENTSFIAAAIIILIICFVTYITCRKQLKENPADTLRIEPPKVKNKSGNFKPKGIMKHLSFSSKWNIRDIFRNKVRTAMGVVGIAGCMMLLVCAFGMLDTLNDYVNWQFEELYNFEYKVTLKDNYTEEEYKEIVEICEGKEAKTLTTKDYEFTVSEECEGATSQTLGIEIKFGDRKEANNIFVSDSKEFIRFTNKDREYITLEDDGIYVTEKLAKKENLKIRRQIKLAYLW